LFNPFNQLADADRNLISWVHCTPVKKTFYSYSTTWALAEKADRFLFSFSPFSSFFNQLKYYCAKIQSNNRILEKPSQYALAQVLRTTPAG
jgi:hypothetical protein